MPVDVSGPKLPPDIGDVPQCGCRKPATRSPSSTCPATRRRIDQLQSCNREEVTVLEGPSMETVVALVGEQMAQSRLKSARGRQSAPDPATYPLPSVRRGADLETRPRANGTSLGLRCPGAAVTGRPDRHFRPGDCLVQKQSDMAPFDRFAAPVQAFIQPVQAPDIARMLAGARQRLVQTQIGPVHGLGFGILSRIH
jgi:hypothetical protein